MIHDQPLRGERLTMFEGSVVLSAFVLTAPCLGETQDCRVEWRTDEVISPWFDHPVPW